MHVFILTIATAYEGESITGVFATLEAAQRSADRANWSHDDPETWEAAKDQWETYVITRWNVSE